MESRPARTSLTGILTLALLCVFQLAEAAPSQAETPKIDVYTMGVGDLFTEKFGHAAMCTRYPSTPSRDRCYNYGTTNFRDPVGMGWGFVRGRSRFWVSVTTPEKMMDLYIYKDRTVWVQELPLSESQARAIANKLRFDSQEENRYYNYHHYHDNCTTRLRDIIDEHTGGLLSRDSDKIIGPSFRDLTRRGFAHSPMLSIASDYVLGRIGDNTPTEYEAMFLPDVFRESLRQRLGVEPMAVYERGGPPFDQEPGLERLGVFLITFILVAPLWFCLSRGLWRRSFVAPALLGIFLGGFLLWMLAILSPLPMARYNENLMLLFPGDIALFWLSAARSRRYARVRVVIILLAVIAAGIGILAQPLWAVAALPLLTLLPFALGLKDARKDKEPADGKDKAPAASTDETPAAG